MDKFTRQPIYRQHCCLSVAEVWQLQGRAVHLASLNWPQTDTERGSVCQCQWFTCCRSNPTEAAFMLLTRPKLHRNKAGLAPPVLHSTLLGVSLHSWWKAAGLGRPGRQSHHRVVGLEEGGEDLCHAVSTSQSGCRLACQHAAAAVPTSGQLWQTPLLILKMVGALLV